MLVILLLAAFGRCASLELCPSNHHLIAAVQSHDATIAGQVAASAAENGEIVLVHPERIRSVKDVICGDRLPGDIPAITCKMTIRYWSTTSYQVAKLVQREGEWQIDSSLAVTRRRR
jgi:hypothetical protein